MTGSSPRRVGLTATIVVGAVIAMTGMSFAAVPLYKAFCAITGYGGTTQVARGAAARVLDRSIAVRFDSNVSAGAPISFEPEERMQTIRIGETGIAKFRVRNMSDRPTQIVASYNVAPASLGQYFQKLECFCFQEQTLQPHEEAEFPVVYYVDPAMAEDFETRNLTGVTLSYTYFQSLDQAAAALAQ